MYWALVYLTDKMEVSLKNYTAECDKMKYCVLCGAALQLRKDMEVHVTVEHDPRHVFLFFLSYNVFFLILYIVFIDETMNRKHT